jgi:tripartite-type tricarboxylate transporter receptor subunit TctC
MAMAMLVANTSAWGQHFPTKPVRVVVPYPPSGSNDVLARPFAQKLSEVFGQPAPAITDLIAGQVQMLITSFPSVVRHDAR